GAFLFSSRRRHTRFSRDWSSDVCSSDLLATELEAAEAASPPDATKVAGLKALIQQTDAEYTRVQKAVSESPAFRTAIAATIGNQIGRASCRGRVQTWEGAASL